MRLTAGRMNRQAERKAKIVSTRANIHFMDGDTIAANIYRHSDGYPSGLGADLHRFLDDTGKLKDSRWNDPEYLAAKFLVWQADQYRDRYDGTKGGLLEFLSVSPCIKDHGDIEYVYRVECNGDRPKIKVGNPGAAAGSFKIITDAQAAGEME